MISPKLTRRSLADIQDDEVIPGKYTTRSGLEIKIALGNYRMFYTPGTEDFFHRYLDTAADVSKEEEQSKKAREKVEAFVKAKLGLEGEEDKMEVEPTPAAV